MSTVFSSMVTRIISRSEKGTDKLRKIYEINASHLSS